MAMHYRSLGVPVLIGVGGTIDFLAGKLKRAPVWMQRGGMEWIFRLLQEPRRLAQRYGTDLWFFSGAILQQWWKLQCPGSRARHTPPSSAVVVEPTWQRIRVPERFDKEAIGRAVEFWADPGQRHCLIELGNVKFIDSTAIALLVHLEKQSRQTGWRLVLLEPSPAVQRALNLMGLEDFFMVAADVLEARQIIKARSQVRAAPAEMRVASPASEIYVPPVADKIRVPPAANATRVSPPFSKAVGEMPALASATPASLVAAV
jgi:N-acetylglucosaminyldiphosphoundecaprenol N-acetyl-beta-D-mannosaminyltransferase